MKWEQRQRTKTLLISLTFLATLGIFLGWLSRRGGYRHVPTLSRSPAEISPITTSTPATNASPSSEMAPAASPSADNTGTQSTPAPTISSAGLIIPVAGVRSDQLLDTFSAARGEGTRTRCHRHSGSSGDAGAGGRERQDPETVSKPSGRHNYLSAKHGRKFHLLLRPSGSLCGRFTRRPYRNAGRNDRVRWRYRERRRRQLSFALLDRVDFQSEAMVGRRQHQSLSITAKIVLYAGGAPRTDSWSARSSRNRKSPGVER
jgi:hypothetical protein